MPHDTSPLFRHRIFTVGDLAFDEATRTLTVSGQTIAIQRRPLDVLQVLLDRAPAAVTPAEIMDTVWRGRIVEESSLTTAIRSLRAALGPDHRGLIENLHGYGYRIPATPLIALAVHEEAEPLSLRAGERAPGHGAWRLVRPLSDTEPQDVWLARHDKSGAERVFKYAGNAARLDALKREAALSRVLRQTLGERSEFAPVLAWHLTEPPFFIEQAWGGETLSAWAEAQGGLAAIPLPRRLHLFAQIARAIADAHGAGVLHGDIKPANVLIPPASPDAVRVIDFGAGGLTAAANRAALSQTLQLASDGPAGHRTGTWLYAAPEILRGAPPSTKADIYALGILLFQFITGGFSQPLSAGWEKLVADPDLREAIDSAAAGDPARRPDSTSSLADVVPRLEVLRAQRAEREATARNAATLAEKLRRAELRRPWLALAAACLVLGAISSAAFALKASRERDKAQHQAHLAQGVNAFLTHDLLSRASPRVSGHADETLTEAAVRAEASVSARFAQDPETAAAIYAALARAFDARLDYTQALAAYDNGVRAYRAFEGPNSPSAAILHLKRADLETYFRTPEALKEARTIVAEEESRLPSLRSRRTEAEVALHNARGAIAFAAADGPASVAEFQASRQLTDPMPEVFDQDERLHLRYREAKSQIMAYQYAEAAKALREVATAESALRGPRSADTLFAQIELAEALELQGESEQEVRLLDRILPTIYDVLGRSHGYAFRALDLQADALMNVGRYAEAAHYYQTLHDTAMRSSGINPEFADDGQAGLGQVKCRSGDTATGLDLLTKAIKKVEADFGLQSPFVSVVAAMRIQCQIEASQFVSAKRALSAVNRDAANIGVPDIYPGETFDLFDAAIAHGLGDDTTARQHLVTLLKHSAADSGYLYYRQWTAKLCTELGVSLASK